MSILYYAFCYRTDFFNLRISKFFVSFLLNFRFNSPILGHYNYIFFSSAYPEYSNCEIIAIPAKYDFKPYGWGFQKDSPFLEMFNYYLDEMREKGANKQIFVKYDPPSQVRMDFFTTQN